MWGHHGGEGAIEPTCLALLALRRQTGTDVARVVHALQNLQNADGSWPAFARDEPEGCWTTAMATLALTAAGRESAALASGIRWLVDARGREANWFWRWKLRTVDKSVSVRPSEVRVEWIEGTTSWVIPTAFSVISLRQIHRRGINRTTAVIERIHLGIQMLLDRMCPGGGWNAGNGVAFGVPYSPYIDATAIALLALAGHEKEPGVQSSLAWIVKRLPGCPSPYSLAWGILALAAYRGVNREVETTLERATNELVALAESDADADDVSTVAVCALALDAVAGDTYSRCGHDRTGSAPSLNQHRWVCCGRNGDRQAAAGRDAPARSPTRAIAGSRSSPLLRTPKDWPIRSHGRCACSG